jgi:methylthioribose-1-phosphate isomerase
MDAAESPLFEPVRWRKSAFDILDESQLPDKVEYIHVTAVSQALEAVRDMRTRAFGQVLTFLYSAALLAQNHHADSPALLGRRLAEMTERFCAARPTFDFRGLGSYLGEWCDQLPAGSAAGEILARKAREFVRRIIRGRKARAQRAAAILPDPAHVLTHCNVSGELVTVARYCQALRKDLRVIATETRPYLQGTRLTAWELAQAGVPVSVIPDCAIAQVMAESAVNAVLVGSDRTARNGDIINKVGTYSIAQLASEYGIPFHAFVQDPRSLEYGADVPIEDRPADELLTFNGQPLVRGPQVGLSVRYPAFDLTPAALITHLIGFDDLYTPDSFRQTYRGAAGAPSWNSEAGGKYILLYGIPSEHDYRFLLTALQGEQALSILVPEMRPQLWGPQVIAPELLEHKVPTTLIADNMMGALFARGDIRKVFLFYTGIDEHGPSGICGMLLAAQLARLHGVPIELFEAGQRDFRPSDKDVSTFLGRRIISAGVDVRAVHDEVIPWRLLRS